MYCPHSVSRLVGNAVLVVVYPIKRDAAAIAFESYHRHKGSLKLHGFVISMCACFHIVYFYLSLTNPKATLETTGDAKI